ncbi:acyltransferase family protein [Methylosinus sporium]|uniref:Acyltransferase n=1 Tax=Methylosinus sporium TaxID=428 RepID=A0A2U1SP57_METSR|nr:acyltransferase [Methylosinus sporium]PWB93397.1 acyltransferase [Methylosinus sporium]
MTSFKKDIDRFGYHNNIFGFIRLLFASFVIIAHTPELIDGDNSRELLNRLFGTISFGTLAVDGFFIVSGYLIVGSFLKNPHPIPYLKKRIARIYPAFIASTLFCIIIVAPLAGATAADIWSSLGGNLRGIIILRPPSVPNVFSGSPYAALNGAMWTISYEFQCYLLVLILGLIGALRRPWMLSALAVICLIGYEQSYIHGQNQQLRLTGIFLFGSLFYLWRDRIVLTPAYTAMALAALLGFLFIPTLAEPAIAIFGSYVIFSIASFGGSWAIARINNSDDISYGVYLYAWPIEKLILWYFPSANPLLAGTATFLIACGFGWLSWRGLEKRVMRLSESWNPPLLLERKGAEILRALGSRQNQAATPIERNIRPNRRHLDNV